MDLDKKSLIQIIDLVCLNYGQAVTGVIQAYPVCYWIRLD